MKLEAYSDADGGQERSSRDLVRGNLHMGGKFRRVEV